jgi:RNA polymerase sigma factor (TIGR02999 family)
VDATAPQQVTQLLDQIRAGREDAAETLLRLVHGELRSMARRQMIGVPAGNTLQPTALVNEAYLRLFGKGDAPWEDRRHFFYAAGRAMRDVLVEQARKHGRLKRGGDRKRLTLDEDAVCATEQAGDLVALDEALQQLEQRDPTGAEIVMLRYFAGLTIEQTAQAMGTSRATVDRAWRFARAWLRKRVLGDDEGDGA